jgi:hypothetical protein
MTGESALVISLVNVIALLAKIAYDKRKNGNPNGFRSAMNELRIELKADTEKVRGEIMRFSERVDRRDAANAATCSTCLQRIARLEVQTEHRRATP